MTKQYNVPVSLIAACGTYAAPTDLIGKRIRITQDSPVHPLAFLFGLPEEPGLREGAEGVVVHVDEQGVIWADFGDDDRARARELPEGGEQRINDIGNVDVTNTDFLKLYEVIEEDAGYAEAA